MNAAEVRALLFKRQLSMENVEWSIPGLPELDGQLATLELRGNDTSHVDKLAEGPDGTTDELLSTAAIICKSLVLRDSKERIFSDTDMGAVDPVTGVGSGVAGFGMSVLQPLSDQIMRVSALGKYRVDTTKKNLPTTPENVSNTFSPEQSVEAQPSQS
jgi:hypothetical protein